MKEIIAIVTTSSVLLGCIAYLIKSVIQQFLARDLKIHETQLQLKAEQQLTLFKDKLERERLRVQIAYSGIFEKQANSIINLYNKVMALELRLNNGISESQSREEYHNLVIEFRSYYHENRILLPESLDKLALEILGSGINIYSESASGKIPSDLYLALRKTKEEAIQNIRSLLSTNS